MSRYRSVKKARTSESQEKDTWAGLDQIGFSQEVVGFGEALSEPIYFGRAFDSPPQFTYSAAFVDSFEQFEDVKAVARPVAGLLTTAGPAPDGRVDHGFYGGWVKDGGFNVQGYWDSYVPKYYEWESPWLKYQKIEADNPSGGFPYQAPFRNWWIQGSSNTGIYWSVVNELSYFGDYAAKCVVDAEGVTPYLAPLCAPDISPWNGPTGQPEQQIWDQHISWFHMSDGKSLNPQPGGYAEIVGSPALGTATFNMKVYSDTDCVVEQLYGVWDDAVDGGVYSYNHKIYKEETFEIEVKANQWNDITTTFTLPEEIWPDRDPYASDVLFGSWRFRIKGDPGSTVYVDDVTGWPDFTTRRSNVPFITIGVSEWIRDEKEMYVGAILWYKATSDPRSLYAS